MQDAHLSGRRDKNCEIKKTGESRFFCLTHIIFLDNVIYCVQLYKQPTKEREVHMITRIVRNFGFAEVCFYVENVSELTAEEMEKIRWLIAEYFEPLMVYGYPQYGVGEYVEIGPRINIETPFSSNAKAICHAMGLDKVVRIEQSILFKLAGTTREKILADNLDIMTQAVYPYGGLVSFDLDAKPEEVQIIPVLEFGEQAIRDANKQMGLGMDDWDIRYYTDIFRRYGRDPTDVELFDIGNANSEHSRHWYWKGKQVIDGVEMPESLMDIVQAPLKTISGQNVSVLAFNDNVGALHGYRVPILVPEKPGQPSRMIIIYRTLHPTATAETHNHPTRVAPYPGAATGIGGRIRDNCAGGRGSMTGIGFSGYVVGNLFIPGYPIPGEVIGNEQNEKYPIPLRVLLEAIEGVADYGNQYGEPSGGGFARAFCQRVSGERREFRKPILYSGGIGTINEAHARKNTPQKGWKIVAIGGPAHPVGKGGGAASSMGSGQNSAGLDYDSVQRGDGEMGNKTVRPLETCLQMGDDNPIEVIHDQGAGGPSNVLKELMDVIGGKIDIRQIMLGDKTMSVLVIWSGEYQERYGLLIRAERLPFFQSVCKRERVNCEVLGEITGDGYATVVDSNNGTTPVHLKLDDILGKLPQKTFRSEHLPRFFSKAVLPAGIEISDAIETTFKQLSVGSKGFIVHRKDRAVGGRVALQQCCGPTQIPIADFAVLADSHFALTGSASALGEQPLKMLIDPEAGARMSVGEMFTNMMGAGGIKRSGIRCRANWMWPAKLPGEGALMYDAAVAMRNMMVSLGIAADGGKDSLSMSAEVGDETVKAPGELVILGYASMPDITRILTPDIKAPGESLLGLIDLGMGKNRLGGSAFLQSLNQLGDETPDCEPVLLRATWDAVQTLYDCGALLSLHDRSDGGLAATVAEMCLGGNSGFSLSSDIISTLPFWFNEELGIVVEFLPSEARLISRVLEDNGAPPLLRLGRTICDKIPRVLGIPLTTVRQWWESTSYQLKRLKNKNGTAEQEFEGYKNIRRPVYELSFTPKEVVVSVDEFRPKVAVLREEGSNSDREMKAVIKMADMDPYDITMSDLLAETATLDDFQFLIPVGGFSFKDTFGSAKGQAGVIRFNEKLKAMFNRFRERKNTLSLAPCNGFQLWQRAGWVLPGLPESVQPQLIQNVSGRFESRWTQVKIFPSPAVMLEGMEGSILGVHCDHGEGQIYFPDPAVLDYVKRYNLVPIVYVNPEGEPTQEYPYNPNGSADAIAGLCSKDGRHLALMPHPERVFLKWQWHYWPLEWSNIKVSPWLRIFQNARKWLLQNK